MKLYRPLVGWLVFVASASVFATLAGLLVHQLTPLIAILSLAAGGSFGLLAILTLKNPPQPQSSSWCDRAACLVFLLVSLRAFLWLAYVDGDRLMVLSPNNLGDLTKHWNYIRYLSSGCTFWPDNPLIAGGTIRYPLGMDLFNSLLVLCGADMLRSLIWVGLAGCLLTGLALYQWGRAFAVAGFLCNGGLAGFQFFTSLECKDFQADMAWKNFFLSMMVTQRGFLFCLPAGLLLLDNWRRRSRSEEPALPFWIEVTLYSSMPLFHFHTFLFLSALLGSWVVWGSQPIRFHALRLGLTSLLPAGFLAFLVTEFFKGPSFFKWQAGWMQKSDPLLQFWLGNFGIFIPLCLILLIALARNRKSGTARAFVFPSLAVFAACCFFLFAPWEWDNTKLMLWAYLAVLPFLWQETIQPAPLPVRICLCVGLFFSGFISLFGGLGGTGYELAKRSELDALENPLKQIPVSARFAATPAYSHPLLLMGRKVAMAYTGYLYGHGVPYATEEMELNSLMHGDPGWRKAAAHLQATYLFWGPREEELYPDSTKPWTATCPAVASGSWGAIYRLFP